MKRSMNSNAKLNYFFCMNEKIEFENCLKLRMSAKVYFPDEDFSETLRGHKVFFGVVIKYLNRNISANL